MLKRALLWASVLFGTSAPSLAVNLDAQLFPLTGEVRLVNNSGSAVPFVYYSIGSVSGALNSSALVWKSITDVYDVSGNGFIDPAFDWTKISSAATELTEGAFSGPGGSLAAFRTVSLGNIWNSSLYPSNDLGFTVLQADMSPVTVTKQYALAGDYFRDGVVNGLDFDFWRQNYGSTTSLAADGNLNGIVDGADYVIWRHNLGMSIPTLGAGSGSGLIGGGLGLGLGSAVPEPTAVLLALSAGSALFIARGRAPRVALRGAHRFSVHQ